MTTIYSASICTSCKLKYKLLLILIAVWAYAVNRLGVTFIFLEKINKCTGAYFGKLISIFLIFPIRYIYQLLFKRLICFQQFVILRLDRKNRSLESNNGAI